MYLNWYYLYKIAELHRNPDSILAKKLATYVFTMIKEGYESDFKFDIKQDEFPELNDYSIEYFKFNIEYVDLSGMVDQSFPFRVIGEKRNSIENKKAEISIKIQLSSKDDIVNYFSYLYTRILENLRHEIQHVNQYNSGKSYNAGTPLNYPRSFNQNIDYKNNIEFFNRFRNAYSYLSKQTENEAFIDGFMERAKNERKPITAIIEEHLNKNLLMIKYVDFFHDQVSKNTEIGKYMLKSYSTIRDLFVNRAKQKYPKSF